MAQGYGTQQMAPMQFEASSGPQTVPYGYSNQTKAPGEAYWAQAAQNPAPQQDAGFHWPQQQYGYPEYYAPNYMHYPQQSFPAFQEPPVMPDMYPNFHQQFNPANKHPPYHAPYQPQFAYPGAPHFQGQYPMYPQQHHPMFPPMMTDSPQSSPYSVDWNRIHEPGSNQRAQGRVSGAPNCDFPGCGRVYTTIALLKAHMKTHLDEAMYHCNWGDCEQKFVTSDELARHIHQHFPFSVSPP